MSIWQDHNVHARELARALDPNTPPEELLALIEQFPNEVVRNPSFELVQVERPDFWVSLCRDAPNSARALAASTRVPAGLVTHCLGQPQSGVAERILMLNPSVDPATRRALFFNNASPPLTQDHWPTALGERGAKLLHRLGFTTSGSPPLQAADLSDEELEEAATSMGLMGLFASVRHPRCPEVAMRRALEWPRSFESDLLRLEVSRHPRLPAELARWFAENPVPHARELARYARRK